MNDDQTHAQAPEDDVSLIHYAVVIWRRRWLVLGMAVLISLTTFVVTISQPKVYDSTASLVIPKEGGRTGNLLGSLAVTSSLLQMPGLPSLTPNHDLVMNVLKSRTIAEAVVARFKLQERYRVQYPSDAIKVLRRATNIEATKTGVIFVTVEDLNPDTAAAIANFYVEQADRLVSRFSTSEAGRQYSFVTQQLAKAKVILQTAEDALRRFQEGNRAIVLQEQTRGAIEAAARLKGEIMAAEVQLQVMKGFATEANPEVLALRRRVEEMQRQLAQMEYGGGASRANNRDFTVPFSRVPEIGLELARLMRDVKIQETLVGLLAQQVEQTKISAADDTPVVQILDQAVPAVRPSKPRPGRNTLIAATVGLLLGVFVAFLIENIRPRLDEMRNA
ncbi:MAG: hypothetical protein DME01_18570 [Candidatus Rokuibacteriota bacterium]|nr:MAG: hypothetical protein DME01_18570 [Candidatus Rokubacteria bacterium]